MRKIALLSVVMLLATGCASIPSFPKIGGGAPSKPQTVYKWNESEKRTPVAVGKDAEGNLLVIDKIERTVNVGYENTPGKLTLGQRIGRFFAGLSVAGILFIVVSLVFFGGAPILFVVRKFFIARRALKTTVAAIEEMNAEDKEKLKVTLAQKQDVKDKAYIAHLKAEIAKNKFKAAA